MADEPATAGASSGASVEAARGGAGFLILFALAAVALLVPLVMVEVPPIVDYPNHLARFYLLWLGHSDPVLSRMYQPDWHVIPDLGFDLFAPWLLAVLPVDVVGRITLAVTLLLPVTGAIAYSRALFGGRSFWPLGAFLVAYNGLFLMGFENLLLSFGTALLSAALYVRCARKSWLLADGVLAAGALATFLMHIVGLAFLALLIGAHKLEDVLRLWPDRRAMLRRAIVQGCGLALILAVPAWLYLSSPLAGAGGPPVWTSGSYKLQWLLGPFMNYNAALDIATAAVLAALLAVVALTGRLRLSLPACIAFAVLAIAYPYLPNGTHGGAYLDVRIPIFLGFLAFCICTPEKLPRTVATTAMVVIALLFAVRTAVVAAVWHGHARELADFRRTIAPISPGSAVLTVIVPGPGRDMLTWMSHPSMFAGNPSLQPTAPKSRYLGIIGMPAYLHMAALVVIERHAFYPLIFADPNQHPLRVAPVYEPLSDPSGVPPSLYLLGLDAIPSLTLDEFPYLADWRRRFDYVLVLNASQAGDLRGFLPDSLVPIRATPIAALFRIRK